MINWNEFSTSYANDLEKGKIGNAREHTQAIVKYYNQAVKTGVITGVPPTLPAPALLGSPAPVGPSTSIPYITYKANQRFFENVIRLYFEGKEILQGKANIQDLIVSAQRLVKKARTTTKEVQAILQQINQVREELSKLPETVEQIATETVGLIKDILLEIRLIKDTFSSQSIRFNNLFQLDVELLTQILNFKPTFNPKDYGQLYNSYKELSLRLKNIQNTNNVETLVRNFFLKKGQEALKNIIDIADNMLNLDNLTQVVSAIATTKNKYNKLVLKLKAVVAQSKFLKAKQSDLEVKITNKQRELKDLIEPKIKEITGLIRKRINENTNKTKSYKSSKVLQDVTKKVKDFKKTLETKIKKVNSDIKRLLTIVNQIKVIIEKLVGIKIGIEQQIKSIVSKLNTVVINKQDNITNVSSDIKQLLNTKKIGDVSKDLFGTTSSLGILLITSLQDKVTNTNELKIIYNQTSRKYKAIIDELKLIIEIEIPYLELLVENYNKPEVVVKKPTNGAVTLQKNATLKTMFEYLDKAEKSISKLEQKANNKIKNLETKIKEQILKENKQIQDYQQELLLTSPAIIGSKSKRIKKSSEKQELQHQEQKGKQIVKQIKVASTAFVAGVDLLGNVNKGSFLIKDNQVNINKLINSYYDYMIISNKIAPAEAVIAKKEKQDKITEFLGYELLITLFISAATEIKNTKFAEDLQGTIQRITITDDQKKVLELLLNIIKNPTIQTIQQGLGTLNTTVLNAVEIVNLFHTLEQKYLKRFKQAIEVTLQNIPKNTKISRNLVGFYESVKKTPSYVLKLVELIKSGITEVAKFIKEQINSVIKDIKDNIKQKQERFSKEIALQKKKFKEKLINVDAKTMSLIFNTATKLYWTGATWQNQSGTTFTVTRIGRFKTIKALPVDGAAGIAKELANSFKLQLAQAQIQVIPNPSTGIPPFILFGYN